ncbi:Glyoxal oxidase [Mycena sanguinolenta]|uniref:Glyoxal oxidase n=1 Tax=Mycena sanguinolenta TaxID=230812 RepID=A0A8H7DCN6_9AGAR|nr:Glyoxal oxidase [Mycena sanguinolenta]
MRPKETEALLRLVAIAALAAAPLASDPAPFHGIHGLGGDASKLIDRQLTSAISDRHPFFFLYHSLPHETFTFTSVVSRSSGLGCDRWVIRGGWKHPGFRDDDVSWYRRSVKKWTVLDLQPIRYRQQPEGVHFRQGGGQYSRCKWTPRLGEPNRDLETFEATVMDIATNSFCASGYHLPNGSFATFGGNGAAGPGASEGSQVAPGAYFATWDSTYQDFDGGQSIRILNPCTDNDDFTSAHCQWFDDPSVLSMQRRRWYSTAEALGNGTIVMIGGFQNGGYILRNVPNDNPTDGAELTYEFYPSNGQTPQLVNFLVKTSGLNAYPLSWLMASGNIFMQANLSSTIWNFEDNTETDLPPMPNGVVRVYPASGANTMLPMTPANNYSQTIIFCGGSDMAEPDWGNFSYPYINTWDYPASNDCQRITPEPSDGSAPKYIQDDDMPVGRTMSQFVILPDGKLLLVNGGLNGTAGFGPRNMLTTQDQMPFGESYASGPVGTPVLYDPEAPAGSRWSSAGFQTSSITRLYHSSAILLPDASVLIAGSNPNLDVNTSSTVPYPTEYRAEKFYPPYFSATTRPVPSGVPSTLSYGGDPFDITIPASSYSGSSNDAANKTIVSVVRGGWTTHAMNFGQRYMQLRNTYTVNKDGSIVLHVAQMYPNPNLFQPGPAMLFVVIDGIPSNGTQVIIGSGAVEAQPTAVDSKLPANILSSDASGSGSATANTTSTSDSSTSHVALIAAIAGGVGVVALLALGVGICLSRRRRARIRAGIAAGAAARAAAPPAGAPYQQVGGSVTDAYLNEQHMDERPWSKPESGANAWRSSDSVHSFDPYHDAMTPVSAHPPAHYSTASVDQQYYQDKPRY